MATFPELPLLKPGPMRGASRTFALKETLLHRNGQVPSGFVTDGASIPRALWWKFSPTGGAFPAAIIHDHDYAASTGTRKDADKRFLSNMKLSGGIGFLARHAFYRAVRIAAGKTWRRNRANR